MKEQQRRDWFKAEMKKTTELSAWEYATRLEHEIYKLDDILESMLPGSVPSVDIRARPDDLVENALAWVVRLKTKFRELVENRGVVQFLDNPDIGPELMVDFQFRAVELAHKHMPTASNIDVYRVALGLMLELFDSVEKT